MTRDMNGINHPTPTPKLSSVESKDDGASVDIDLTEEEKKATPTPMEGPVKMFMERKTLDYLTNEGLVSFGSVNVFMLPENAVKDQDGWVGVKIVADERNKPKEGA